MEKAVSLREKKNAEAEEKEVTHSLHSMEAEFLQ